jgi:hypothetical protein
MKRKWYQETFNRDTLETDDQIEEYEWEETKHEYAELKSKLLVNVVEFIVWVILLVFCFMYLQSHPAEKTSLFSWIDVIGQKVKIFFVNLTWWNAEDVEAKFKLEQLFDEILSTSQWSNCLSESERDTVVRITAGIKALSVEEFLENERAFRRSWSKYYRMVTEECGDSSQGN